MKVIYGTKATVTIKDNQGREYTITPWMEVSDERAKEWEETMKEALEHHTNQTGTSDDPEPVHPVPHVKEKEKRKKKGKRKTHTPG